MTDATCGVDMVGVTGTAAIPPPAGHLAGQLPGQLGGSAGGLVPGAWIAAVLVALAAAVLLLPARRDLPRGWTTGTPAAQARPTMRQAALDALHSRRTGVPEPDLGLLLTEVASLLRAGATPQRAWTRACRRAGLTEGAEPDEDGVPPVLCALADLQYDSWLPRWSCGRLHWHPPPRGRRARQRRATAAGVPGAVASCRLSTALGAPLADILQGWPSPVAPRPPAGPPWPGPAPLPGSWRACPWSAWGWGCSWAPTPPPSYSTTASAAPWGRWASGSWSWGTW